MTKQSKKYYNNKIICIEKKITLGEGNLNLIVN